MTDRRKMAWDKEESVGNDHVWPEEQGCVVGDREPGDSCEGMTYLGRTPITSRASR